MRLAIDRLSDVLLRCSHFDALRALCAEDNAYLVGGCLRDALIGRQITDLDLIFPDDPTELARRFARQIGGHWFWLDQPRLQSRVVTASAGHALHYDFAKFRAPNLHADLSDRDFTINAMALPLSGPLSQAELIDPFNGLSSLQDQQLRMVSQNALPNDPLRIIKGVRHATVLGLQIEEETLAAMQSASVGLERIAVERIRQEFWQILADQQAGQGLTLLRTSGAGRALFGPDFDNCCAEMVTTLKACRKVWATLAKESSVVAGWLKGDVEQGLCQETLLLCTFLLARIAPALPGQWANAWRLSRRARSNITSVAALNATALDEFSRLSPTSRAFAWWANRYQIAPQLLLLALAALAVRQSPARRVDILPWVPLLEQINGQRPNDLVDGHWLCNQLGLAAGPQMTEALQLLRQAEIFGQVESAEAAREFLLRHYRNKD